MKPESELSTAKRALIAQWRRGQAPINPDASARASAVHVKPGSVPLSFGQQQVWFFSTLAPNSPLYNIPIAVRLSGEINVSALQKALNLIVERHEILRSRFVGDPRPMQLVEPPSAVPLEVIDLRELPVERREAEATRLAEQEIRRPFDLTKDLMIRARLIRIEAHEWVFVIVMHHIASDIWSWRLICRELQQIYNAIRESRNPELPQLPIQYSDFVRWQEKECSAKALPNQLVYWKTQLANAPKLLELPLDHPRPAIQSFQGAAEFFTVSPILRQKLEEFAQREGVTLFMTLLAAFQTLIYRYTHQEDLVIGSPSAGRSRVEFENLVGNFVNTLILRTSLHGNPSVRELLQRTRDVVLEALANQDISFESIVNELRPERSSSHLPLVQVMFALQDELAQNLSLPQIQTRPMEADTQTSKFDLTLTVIESGGTLKLWAEYNTHLYQQATIQRMLRHYEQLLEGIVSQPAARLSELVLLTEEENRQIQSWNNTKSEYPKNICVHELFQQQVEKTPEAIAVIFNGCSLTYRELNQKVDKLAGSLKSMGVEPEDLVAVCLDRSADMVAAILAIWKTGAAYVPVEPSRAVERIRLIIQDAKPRLLVTTKDLLGALALSDTPVLCLDGDVEEKPQDFKVENLPRQLSPDNLAYVIYTSGSTGVPKGVQIPHRAVVNFLTSMRKQPGITESDVLLAVTSLSFDISGLELFLPLTTGARVVIADSKTVSDGAKLGPLIEASEATVMQATPATWRMLLESGWEGSKRLKILCGGETLPRPLADALVQKSAELWNLYGPTETTIWSTLYQVTPGTGPVPIGKPIANTQVYVLDPHLKPVPPGVFGELFIGGDGLARGYFNRPELTAEKFISNPFDATPDNRLYRTGDQARFLADGNLQFLGRRDHQVKIRGHRIELGEIEAGLGTHPAIRQVVVNVKEDGKGDPLLIAYFTFQPSVEISLSELRKFLEQKLPLYAIPSAFVPMQNFPLTASGKIDRKALPSPAPERNGSERERVLPESFTEQALARIWCEVLELPSVGIHDNFFEIGGHSLRLTQVISRVRQVFDVEIPFVEIFQSPTISKLASHIENVRVNGVKDPIPASIEKRIIKSRKTINKSVKA